MRNYETKRLRSSSVPVYTFDTDSNVERVIRDPLTVLLGRSTLRVESAPASSDPYNRVGRLALAAYR